MTKAHPAPSDSESAIFSRIIETAKGNLAPRTARYFLHLDFPVQDKARMHVLAVKNQEGALSAAEREELDNYVKAGHLLALLQSKARKALKKKKVS